jgi:hypothetical protein
MIVEANYLSVLCVAVEIALVAPVQLVVLILLELQPLQ